MKNSMKRILLHISLLGTMGTMCAMWQEPLSQEELQKLKQQAISLSGQYQVEQPVQQQHHTRVNVIEALREQALFLCDQQMQQYYERQRQVEEPKYPTAERNQAQKPNQYETKRPFATACEKDDIKNVEALLEKEAEEHIATAFVYHAHTVQVVSFLLEKRPKLLKPYLRHRLKAAVDDSLLKIVNFLLEKYDFERPTVVEKTQEHVDRKVATQAAQEAPMSQEEERQLAIVKQRLAQHTSSQELLRGQVKQELLTAQEYGRHGIKKYLLTTYSQLLGDA